MQPFNRRDAIAHLSKVDPKLAKIIEQTLEFKINVDEAQTPYESLLRAIVYQSISGKVARVIHGRIRALGSNGCAPTPEELLRVDTAALRKAGLSNAKVAAVRDLAQKTIDGVVPTLADAEKMSDQQLVERLTSVRGIGAWTVEMFLIFRLHRPDVLPIHDLGVQKGFAIAYGKRFMPSPRDLAKFGERWRPYRSVASWYLWRACELPDAKARKILRKPRRIVILQRAAKKSVAATKPAAAKVSPRKSTRQRPDARQQDRTKSRSHSRTDQRRRGSPL